MLYLLYGITKQLHKTQMPGWWHLTNRLSVKGNLLVQHISATGQLSVLYIKCTSMLSVIGEPLGPFAQSQSEAIILTT